MISFYCIPSLEIGSYFCPEELQRGLAWHWETLNSQLKHEQPLQPTKAEINAKGTTPNARHFSRRRKTPVRLHCSLSAVSDGVSFSYLPRRFILRVFRGNSKIFPSPRETERCNNCLKNCQTSQVSGWAGAVAQVVILGHVAMATFFSILYNTGEETNSDIFPLDFAVGKIQVRGCFYCPAVEIWVDRKSVV